MDISAGNSGMLQPLQCDMQSWRPRVREAGFLTKTCSATLLAILMTGCAADPNNNSPNPVIVRAQTGQTIKQAVDSLPSNGGVVVLGIGTWSSGYLHGGYISSPNVTIRGSGMPSYNSQFTAMTGGTIV